MQQPHCLLCSCAHLHTISSIPWRMPHCLQCLSMCSSSSGRGQALLSRCTARHTYLHKYRQGAGETVPKHYTVLHTSIRTHMIGKITKSMASLHARTLIRSVGQMDNCVEYKDITVSFVKYHAKTESMLTIKKPANP